MTAFCHLAALVSVSLATGQDPVVPPKQEAKKDFNPAAVGSLVPEKLGAELKLTNEQRKQVDALEQEFHKQRKAALTITMMKVQTILDKIEREEEPAPALAVTALITNTMLDLSRTKGTYEKKVSETLTPDQQRVFAAWQKLKPKDKKEPTPEMQELFRELEHWIDGPEWQAKDNHERTKKGDKKLICPLPFRDFVFSCFRDSLRAAHFSGALMTNAGNSSPCRARRYSSSAI